MVAKTNRLIRYLVKVADYYKRNVRFGQEIHLELCKRLKFEPTTKWYKHKAEYILKKTTPEIVCNFGDSKTSPKPTLTKYLVTEKE